MVSVLQATIKSAFWKKFDVERSYSHNMFPKTPDRTELLQQDQDAP